jgi:hypothetical protein
MLRAAAWLYRQSTVSDIDVTAITAKVVTDILCWSALWRNDDVS